MNTRESVRKLCIAALLVALDVVLARFLSIEIVKGNRIGLQFLAYGLEGWLLGPYWAVLAAVAGDALGMMVNSGGYTFSLLFTLVAVLKGLAFGLVLHRKPVGVVRAAVAVLLSVLIDMTLSSYAMALILDTTWWAYFWMKLPFRLVTLPVYVALLYVVQTVLQRIGVDKELA